MNEGADVHACESEAFRSAARRGHTDVVRLLIAHGAKVNACKGEALINAAKTGHHQMVKLLLALPLHLIVVAPRGNSRLLPETLHCLPISFASRFMFPQRLTQPLFTRLGHSAVREPHGQSFGMPSRCFNPASVTGQSPSERRCRFFSGSGGRGPCA